MIFTFYSYKGGVGRSTALANVAEWLYQQGARVLMIDWDLEAPGLESFFYQTESELNSIRSKEGLMDLLLEYRKQYARAVRTAETRDPESIFRHTIGKLKPFEYWVNAIHTPSPNDGTRRKGLWLLSAGLRHERFPRYAEEVHDFNWPEFYSDYNGERFFAWLRDQAAPKFSGYQLTAPGFADVVLIDSRTGITEMGGVCTQELADVVVAFSAPNLQNLAGVATMLRSFRRPEILNARNGKPEVILVPSRVDASELDSRNRFEKRLRGMENEFVPAILQSLKRSFWDLKIPYVARFAYEEALTFKESSGSARYIEAGEMAAAFQQLAVTLVMLTPTTHTLRTYTQSQASTLFEKRRVYLTWAGASGTALANALRLKLETEAPDLDLWLQQRDSAVPVMEAQSSEAIASASSLLLAFSAESINSPWIRNEWQQARRTGTCVAAVYSGTLAWKPPVWMRKGPLFELSKDWPRLLQNLRARCTALRAPFMARDLPSTFVLPKDRLDLIRTQVLTPSQLPQARRCVLHGMGGSGKSILAAALCHEPVVIDAFDDGVLWVTVGQQPDIRACLTQLYSALTSEQPSFTSDQQASLELGAKLASLSCLIVLDHVWTPQHLTWFFEAGKNSAFIITTRNASLATDSFSVQLGEMSGDEASYLLNKGIDLADPRPLFEVADQLARLPLALYLARSVLLERIKQGESPERACQYLKQMLNRRGFQNFAEVGQSLERSLTLLSPKERERFYELARFPERSTIPVSSAANLWGLDQIEAEPFVQQFARLSLIEFDPASKTFLLHPAFRSYIETVSPVSAIAKRQASVPTDGDQSVTLIAMDIHRDVFKLSIGSNESGSSVPQSPLNVRLLAAMGSQVQNAETLQAQIDAGQALYQLLISKQAQQAIPFDRPMVVHTQSTGLQIPWEMLVPPGREQPLGLDPGVARSFPTIFHKQRKREASKASLSALVITPSAKFGSKLPDMPGAEQEGREIATLFVDAGINVNIFAGKQATALLTITELLTKQYDLVHFAGTQLVETESSAVGWAFEDAVLSVAEISRFSSPPQLIFSNACPAATRDQTEASSNAAAAMAEGLLAGGALNFVGASAPISDRAAFQFAVLFYKSLLKGMSMYQAIRHARSIRSDSEGLRTWGAYQHFGDPFFHLFE